MGTNYYARTDVCECCGRGDERHICKSLTSFRGYSEFDLKLRSWRDWKSFLQRDNITVWTEYGEQIPVEKFIADVEATPREARERQTRWVLKYHDPSRDWLDAEGFSFHDGEFC